MSSRACRARRALQAQPAPAAPQVQLAREAATLARLDLLESQASPELLARQAFQARTVSKAPKALKVRVELQVRLALLERQVPQDQMVQLE